MAAPPPLRDPVADFVNRFTEKRRVEEFCGGADGGNRCLIVRAGRDVGTTFFLRHLEKTAEKKWFAVYADCDSSDPEIIFRRFFERLEETRFLRWRAMSVLRELGEAVLGVVFPILSPANWASSAGPLAGAMILKVATTPYASTSSERFARLITSGRWKRPVLFLVDNAQEIKPQSLNILNTVFSERYGHVRFVLSFVGEGDGAGAFEEFEQRLRGFGLGARTMDFAPPDERFVAQIASALGVPLAAEERGPLVRATSGRLSRILGTLRGGGRGEGEIGALETEILRYLLVAGQPLRRDDLLKLALASARFAWPGNEVGAAVDGLTDRRLVVVRPHFEGEDVEVAPGQERLVREAVPPVADLVAAQELYAYFTRVDEVRSVRHSQSAYGALLYRLAKRVDPAAVPQRAFELVRISLGQGDLAAAQHYVERATGGAASEVPADLYALLAFRVSVLEFGPALETLERLGRDYWQGVRMLRVIHAICLNRVRRHASSAAEIDALLAEPGTTDEEFALLTSYRVAGLLHEGMLVEARDAFEEAVPRLRAARNRGYALRNCAAVYFWGETRDTRRAAEVLEEASAAFRAADDAFGLYTTLNNQGALAGTRDRGRRGAAAALPAFQEAFRALAVFGTQHLEEVGANLGTALLLTRDLDHAAAHLVKMTEITAFDFPRVIVESALAFVELLRGDPEGARGRMWRLTHRAAAVGLPEATYRAYVNAAAVEAAAGTPDRFEQYVEGARNAGFWGGVTSLHRVLAGAQGGAMTRETLPDYFSYDYFQYWSQNPLTVLATPRLPLKAEGDHVAH